MTATQLQIRRDTAANIALSTPVSGEIWYDTTNKRLNVGDGANVGGIEVPNYIDVQNGSFDYSLATGTANAIDITTAPSNPTAYATGQRVRVKIATTNTGSTTLNWGALGVKTIKKWSSGSLIDLVGSELISGMIVTFDYDGTYFVLISTGGGGIIVSRQVFTTSGTWTKPSNLLYADIEVCGGGGGGGGYGTTAVAGGTGGTSSFGSHCSSTGGGGGGGFSPSTTGVAAGGGVGTATGGDINSSGGYGSNGNNLSGNTNGGNGGASFFGGGGRGNSAAGLAYGSGGGGAFGGAGSTGAYSGCGGGGSGAYSRKIISNASLGSTETITVGAGGAGGNATSNDGGAGKAGIVIVTEFRSA